MNKKYIPPYRRVKVINVDEEIVILLPTKIFFIFFQALTHLQLAFKIFRIFNFFLKTKKNTNQLEITSTNVVEKSVNENNAQLNKDNQTKKRYSDRSKSKMVGDNE